MHPLAHEAFDAGFQPNLTALLDCILTRGVEWTRQNNEESLESLRNRAGRITQRMKAIGLDHTLIEKVDQALRDAFE